MSCHIDNTHFIVKWEYLDYPAIVADIVSHSALYCDIIKLMKNPNRKKLKKHAYTAAQWTWGLPQTLIGAALYAVHRKDDHFDYRGARATAWDRDAGGSLGKFIFVPRRAGGNAGRFLLEHEYGHTLQSLILGPFYLLVVGAPSMLWNRLPYFKSKRRRTGKSYYSAPFEKTANILAVHAHKHEQ